MHTRRWKAAWIDSDGAQHEYHFASEDNRILAEIDFRMKLIDQGLPVPQYFTLEEGRKIIQVVPSLKELEGRR